MPDHVHDLSVCITVKNRSRAMCSRRPLNLFPNCLTSLREAVIVTGADVEVVIADFQSDDWPLLEWVPVVLGDIRHSIIPVNGDFGRGKGRNIAAARASGRLLFFLDADMLVSPETLTAGFDLARIDSAVFPLAWEYRDQGHRTLDMLPFGTGNCFVCHETFTETRGWIEWQKWGFEDWGFMVAVANHATIHRPKIRNFIHQWHPDSMRDQFDREKWSDNHGTQNGVRPL